MILTDVNVLVYAHREDVRDHTAYRQWLESVINSGTDYGFSELVLSGFVRVATHPRMFEQPSSLETALAFAEQIRMPEHAALGRGAVERRAVYRGLFDKHGHFEQHECFRAALQTGTPLGSDKFKVTIPISTRKARFQGTDQTG